ncbi:CoA transferase, partial [Streptomyces tanashiensis]
MGHPRRPPADGHGRGPRGRERHLRVDGRAPVSFAPLSRFWRAADGWVRTH